MQELYPNSHGIDCNRLAKQEEAVKGEEFFYWIIPHGQFHGHGDFGEIFLFENLKHTGAQSSLQSAPARSAHCSWMPVGRRSECFLDQHTLRRSEFRSLELQHAETLYHPPDTPSTRLAGSLCIAPPCSLSLSFGFSLLTTLRAHTERTHSGNRLNRRACTNGAGRGRAASQKKLHVASSEINLWTLNAKEKKHFQTFSPGSWLRIGPKLPSAGWMMRCFCLQATKL